MNLSEKLPRSWIIGYVVVLVGATAFYASNPPWRETMGFFLNGLSSAAVILGALYIAEAVLLAARTIGLPGKAGGGEGGKEIDKFWKEFCDALKVLKPTITERYTKHWNGSLTSTSTSYPTGCWEIPVALSSSPPSLMGALEGHGQAGPSLPVGNAEAAALLRRVPFGEALATEGATDDLNGYTLVLSLPRLLNELLGNVVAGSVIEELQLIEAHLLIHLQFLDDDLDGQSQMGPGDPAVPLHAALQRLANLFGPDDPFWKDYERLTEEQEWSARWERAGRGAPLPSFDDALFRALIAKAALLRWPASALARLAGRSDARCFLDDVSGRLIGVVLLFDESRGRRGRRAEGAGQQRTLRGPRCGRRWRGLPPPGTTGGGPVCAKAHAELARVKEAVPNTALARLCDHLAERCTALEGAFAEDRWTRVTHHIATSLGDALRAAGAEFQRRTARP